MRIGLDTNSVLAQRSGAATYFLELLPSLLAHAVGRDELIVLHGEEDDATPLAFLLRNEKLSERTAPFGGRRSNGLWRLLSFPAVERFVNDGEQQFGLDVCHTLAPPLMPSRAATRVLTLHQMQPTRGGRLPAPLRRSLAAANRVICTSNRLKQQVQTAIAKTPRCERLADKLTVVPPGVHPRFRETPKAASIETLFQRFPFLEEPYLLCTDLSANQGALLMLLEAWARAQSQVAELPPIVMCVTADASFEVMDLLRREGFEGRLLLIEEPEVELLPALYRGANCLLSPSQQFEYGIPVLEAAAAGIPAIVGEECGALEELGSALLVPENDSPEAWAHSMLRMQESPEERRGRGREGRDRAAAVTWEKAAARHWKIYRGLVTGEIDLAQLQAQL
ncbi:MAG: glycosyltransferase [Acidobacteria bacterium]|nr:MAG: glycosyltransferase [Acidobacteriota bacterium]REK04597.1 MAG: glycosyltransferase [Acidobacteriota bacterium]